MEHAVIGYLGADSSSPATFLTETRQSLSTAGNSLTSDVADVAGDHSAAGPGRVARRISPARLAAKAQHGKGASARAPRGSDLRQARVLMQALCEMRLVLGEDDEALSSAALDGRHTATMALWQNRTRSLYTQPDVERSIEARLDAGFRHARRGNPREAAGEFKRAYLLLCCVLTLARDNARAQARGAARGARGGRMTSGA
ncbi:hypothetical protein D9X30_4150 [Cupriavidus sp. U2]|uniref:hypothetical protein n=1 Tax=Cupriavidus sp. U2 TaxID=2920269 RepID=UPI00129E0886|nr:hypothetical protein [Cupriavidus sp. U2]KAI3590665.1 hypothetical protein D9X30_4150 [Cupriavidus sp. U2]